jgi:hypothetical protein
MKLFYIIVLDLLVSFTVYGQSKNQKSISAHQKISGFTEIADVFPNIYLGSADWGDYDKDGDLDLLISGIDASNILYAELYRNNGDSTFTNINAGFEGIERGVIQWTDYNNDGYLDVFITGRDSNSDCIAKVYSNDKDGTFSEITTGITGLYESDAGWADYNNDGWLDLLISGATSSNSALTILYKNNGDSTFSEVSDGFVNSLHADIVWFDYNKDGLRDVIITGHDFSSSSPLTRLYSNNGNGTFSVINTGILNLTYGDVKVADLNADGFQDVIIAGSNSGRYAYIYKNNGDSTFTQQASGLTGVIHCAISTSDYDNDGDIDVYVSGGTSTIVDAILYTNTGNFTFTSNTTSFTETSYPAAAWGDYNNDTKPDHFISGQSDAGRIAKIYSSSFAANTVPELPANLSSEINCNSVTLKWNHVNDAQNSAGLNTYNIYVGTNPGMGNIVNPTADLSTGFRYINKEGNNLFDTLFTIADLQPGTYYWSVQALDVNNLPSDFADEQSFTITDNSISIIANPQNASVCENIDTSFMVTTSGPVTSYLWQYSKDGGSNWRDTTGTTARFEISNTNISLDQYKFRCKVSSTCETITSNTAILTVKEAPEKPIINQDGPDLYSSFANHYQWFDDNGEITNATDQMFTPTTSGNYYVEVENSNGCENTSDNFLFTFLSKPQITNQPQDAAICQSLDTAFSVIATGDEISYNWQRSTNGGLVFENLDVNTNKLVIDNASLSNTGYLFRCKITNAYYEIISDTVELTVHENPVKPVITNNSGTLTSTDANSYLWFKNGTIINGATNKTYSPTENGNYTVMVTNSFGCSSESDPFNFVVNSIDELNQLGIHIYPNPAREYLNISFVNKPEQVIIYSLTGSKFYSKKNILENNLTIFVKDFLPGIYFIQLNYTDKTIKHKIVIEK